MNDTPAAKDESAGVPSPCIKQCELDADRICKGCRRTLDEIATWSSACDAEKAAIWRRLRSLPPRASEKTCARCGSRFTCGNGGRTDGECWCMDLPRRLPADFDTGDCLCPVCLRQALERRP